MFKIVLSNSQGPMDTRRCRRDEIGDTVQRMILDNAYGTVVSDKIMIEVV